MYLVLEDPLDLGSASAARHPLHANKAHAAARNLAHHITHGNKNVAATSGLCTSITPTWSTMASASASDESGSPRAATSRGGRCGAGAGVVPASPPAARGEAVPATAATGRGGWSGDGGEPAARPRRQQYGPPRGGEKEGRPRTYRRLHCCSATTTSSCYDLLNYGSVVGN